jgi:hypothetical protein
MVHMIYFGFGIVWWCVECKIVNINMSRWHWVIICRNPNLGHASKARACKVAGKKETRECGKVWEWTFTFPSELPCWELESQGALECLESDCKGQNPSPWKVLYIIGNLLKQRCLKWAHMTHLDIETQVMV